MTLILFTTLSLAVLGLSLRGAALYHQLALLEARRSER